MSDQSTHPRAAGRTSTNLGNQARPHLDLYQAITNKVIEMLEQGVAPWRSCIMGEKSAGHPKNLNTGKQYRGVNVFLLAFTAYVKGFESAYWLTLQQANERGGKIKRGEKASMVVFWKPREEVDKKTGEVRKSAVMRYYNVFNAMQCNGLEVPDEPKYTPSEFKAIEEAQRIVDGYKDGPQIKTGGTKAFYTASTDVVKLPEPTRYESTEEFYATLFHELAHSTGHKKRLDRKLAPKLSPFGGPEYGKEELVAEMAAAFLCAKARIDPVTLPNQAAYLKGWLGTLKKDKRLIVAAGGQAQRAADWILGRQGDAASVPDGDDRFVEDIAETTETAFPE